MSSRASQREKARISSIRKFQILRSLINSKSLKKSSVLMDAMLYICKLKFKLESIRRELQHLRNNIPEVKVEKLEGSKFFVRVTCKMGQDLLVSILEEFEKLKINVCQARITSKHFFVLEAMVEAGDEFVDVKILTQAIDEAVQK